MDVDSDNATTVSNVDDWLACFSLPGASKPGAFPFTSHKTLSIESHRARMSDLLIFDVLLIRGGIRSPDMLFPPTDWTALRKLLAAIDESVYDILKKDCLVYILLKWAWDIDPRETNSGWDVRYLQDRCIAPQFAALADAYWLLDTGTHLSKAVSILSDARLNRDYVSKILQALVLSSSPASFASDAAPDTAALVVKYVRTAKPLLTEPDDIDLYALSLAQLCFMDAWTYQKSFPEGSDTRERLLRKIVGWCLTSSPKQEPLVQLLALPLSPYEQSYFHMLALPSQFSTSSSLSGPNAHTTATLSDPVLSPQAISILQDLLCVRAIQSGDYVGAIKLDRQFSSVSPSLGGGVSTSSLASQPALSSRDAPDRKTIIQDLFATLPPAERTLLEDEIGKVATGVRANTSLRPRQGAPTVGKPLMAEMSLNASWEDVGTSMGSPAPSTSHSVSAVGASFAGKAMPVPVYTSGKINSPFSASISVSPIASHAPRPKLVSVQQVLPTPKFTTFGSPIPPPTGVGTGKGVISEQGKALFSANAVGGLGAAVKPATHVSLFETAGSAKNAPNAFYKPPSVLQARVSLDVGSALASSSIAKSAAEGNSVTKQSRKTQGGESDGEDVNMGHRLDIEIMDHRGKAGREEQDKEIATDEDHTENFIVFDKSGAADLTLHGCDVDEVMGEDGEAGLGLGFSVFSGSRSVARNDNAGGQGKRSGSRKGHSPYTSPPSHTRGASGSLATSVNSATGRSRAPPGAFHQEEEDDDQNEKEDKDASEEGDEEDGQTSQIAPVHSPRRSARAKIPIQTPSRPSAHSQPHSRGTPSSRPKPSQTIPGALTDEDTDEHGQDDTNHAGTRDGEDTEIDEQEDDAIGPLPVRTSRRTRSSGLISTSTSTSRAKSSAKPVGAGTATDIKGRLKARPPEVKTPARRSSRLSTASSLSPDYTDVASPTKKGRKNTGPRGSAAEIGSGTTVATRSSMRRKR